MPRMRCTKADAVASFQRLLKLLGKREATAYNDVGGWWLETEYRRYRIEEVISERGGVRHPLWSDRLRAAEWCDVIYRIECALWAIERREPDGTVHAASPGDEPSAQ